MNANPEKTGFDPPILTAPIPILWTPDLDNRDQSLHPAWISAFVAVSPTTLTVLMQRAEFIRSFLIN